MTLDNRHKWLRPGHWVSPYQGHAGRASPAGDTRPGIAIDPWEDPSITLSERHHPFASWKIQTVYLAVAEQLDPPI